MSYQGQEKARFPKVSRWKFERGGLPWGRGPSVGGRSFEEDLALFERQVSEEAGGKDALDAAPVSTAALSA